MAKISVVIVVKNEEKKLKNCLESVLWADEIIVVDDESTDKSPEIAKKYTKKVYFHKSVGFVEPARNFAIDKATNQWIFLLDADEQVSKELGEKLREISEQNIADVVLIPRKNIIFNKWIKHTGWWPDNQVRYFKKGKAIWSDTIHAKPQTAGEILTLPAEETHAILHYNYESISQFVRRMDIYTTIQATQNQKTFSWRDMIQRPGNEFLSRFFAQEGYKDGLHGLSLSLLMACYQLLVVIKQWEKQEFSDKSSDFSITAVGKEFDSIRKDSLYWMKKKNLLQEKNLFKKTLLRFRK